MKSIKWEVIPNEDEKESSHTHMAKVPGGCVLRTDVYEPYFDRSKDQWDCRMSGSSMVFLPESSFSVSNTEEKEHSLESTQECPTHHRT